MGPQVADEHDALAAETGEDDIQVHAFTPCELFSSALEL